MFRAPEPSFPQGSLQHVSQALADDRVHVTLEALQALRSLGEPAAPHAHLVAPLLQHYSVDVRCLAALLLGEVGKTADGAVWAGLLCGVSAHTRRAGLVGLGRLRRGTPTCALPAGRTALGGSRVVLEALGLNDGGGRGGDGMSVELRRARAEELAQMLPGTTAPFAVEIGASRRRRARALAPRQRHSPRPRSLFAGHLLRDTDARVRQSAVVGVHVFLQACVWTLLSLLTSNL